MVGIAHVKVRKTLCNAIQNHMSHVSIDFYRRLRLLKRNSIMRCIIVDNKASVNDVYRKDAPAIYEASAYSLPPDRSTHMQSMQ